MHEGEVALENFHLNNCCGKSYSGPIHLTHKIEMKDIHCNDRHPSMDDGAQETIWLMTCAPLAVLEDLKVLIREGFFKICPPPWNRLKRV